MKTTPAAEQPRTKRKYTRRAPAAPKAQAAQQQNGQADQVPAAPAPKPRQIQATPEFLSDLRQAAFVLDTVAHHQGMTAEFGPIAARFRAIANSK